MRSGLGLLLGLQLVGQTPRLPPWLPMPPPAPKADLTPGAAAALWKQLDIREPFLDSLEARQEPQSLFRFFGKQDYEQLRGNPALGYFATGGFRWVGTRIAWQGLRPVTPDAAAVAEQAWDAAFRAIAKRHGWQVDPRAPIRAKGACVGCVAEPSAREPQRGVCIEFQPNRDTPVSLLPRPADPCGGAACSPGLGALLRRRTGRDRAAAQERSAAWPCATLNGGMPPC